MSRGARDRELDEDFELIRSGPPRSEFNKIRYYLLELFSSYFSGCLQLLEILEISLNLYGSPGNFV